MITYKGQRTVIGKRFIYEGEVIKYTGKIYGDNYNFTNKDGVEYVLSESDLANLEEYELSEADSNIINNISGKDELKKTLVEYTEKELALLNDIINGKSKDTTALNNLYQDELDKLLFLNKYDMPIKPQDNITLEAQKSYLDELNRNVSDKNIVAILTSLQSFIASNKKGGEDNGNI